MVRFTVKKLDFTKGDVRQKSFQVLYAAYNGGADRTASAAMIPKTANAFRKLGKTACYGVFQGAEQIGFGILSDLHDGSYRISYVSVDPVCRHAGAGRKLVRTMLRRVADMGGTTVIVQPEAGNRVQRKWFQSMGFSSLKRGTDDGTSLVLTVDDRIRAFLDLCDTLDRYANLVYGFYEVDEEPYCDTYPVALVLMHPFRCTEKDRDEIYHENLIHEKERLNTVLRSVSNYLNDQGISNLPMPAPRDDVDESLSRKAAALRAGLGWLGKNDRVVHRIYGAKTVTCRIYINADFPVNTYIRRNTCGDCRLCVDACPVACLKDKKWSPKVPRKEVIDEAACLEYRSRSYPQTGLYEECDRCLRCCGEKKN